jgi:DNA-binding transcriptional MerR regulator
MVKDKGIAKAAAAIDCSEGALRRLEGKGIVHPVRDPWGRRLYGEDDIAAGREYLGRQGTQGQDASAQGAAA